MATTISDLAILFFGREIGIQKWLIKDCLINHNACHPPLTPFLPSRLIDIRAYPVVRLVRTRLLPINSLEDLRYIALSYCWGPSMSDEGKTTSRNLEDHEKSIDIQKLPRTLVDAVKFTRSLGVAFLWVDALCILQDDKADWDREASSMSLVYARAFITIAAATSNHCESGFLKASYRKSQLPVPRRGAYGMELDFHTPAEEPNPWVDSFLENPLLDRGWALQERELSPRMLHFTKMHVVWECRERVRCYIRPRYWIATPDLRDLNLHHFSSYWRLRCFDIPSDKRKPRFPETGREWPKKLPVVYFSACRNIIEDYSTRKLTVATDKLAAIDGLATPVQEIVKCDYLAGMWRDTLLEDLLWWRSSMRTVHGELVGNGVQYYAPTWSWGWTNFPISFHVRADKIVAEVLEARVLPAGARENLTGGVLRLHAKVLDMPGNATEAEFHLDTWGDTTMLERYQGIVNGVPYGSSRNRPKGNFIVCIIRTSKTVETEFGGRENKQIVQHYYPGGGLGLILQPVQDRPLCYRRIGFVDKVPFKRFQDVEYQDITIV